MEGEAQHSDQRFWFARDGGVSWGAGLSVLKPGRSQANRDSWSPSQWPPSDSPGENGFQTRSSTGGTPEPAFKSIPLHSEV